MKTENIESAVVQLFNPFRNVIIPRIKDAVNLQHECDLLIVHPSGYATEVEIKSSISDLRNDFKKKHGHESLKIRRMFYAVPAAFQGHQAMTLIPERCGIILVHEMPIYQSGIEWIKFKASISRKAKARKDALQWNDHQINLLLKNIHLKFWIKHEGNLIRK